MSLINQMLKDLDSRHGPVNGTQAAALQSMGLVSANHVHWQQGLPLAGWGLAAILSVFIGYQAVTWWLDTPGPAEVTRSVIRAVPAERPVPDNSGSRQSEPASEPAVAVTAETAPVDKPVPVPIEHSAKPKQEVSSPTTRAVNTPVIKLTPMQKADRLFIKAQQALATHRQQRGKTLLQRALDEFPGHTDARTQLATLLISAQHNAEAEQLLVRGLTPDSTNLDLAKLYAQLLSERGAFVAALETLDRAIEMNSVEPEALALRAAILYRMERHAESAATYKQALQFQPHQALWWAGLGVSLEHSKQPQQALEAYRKASQLPLDEPVNDYVKQRIQSLRISTAHY